MNENLRDRVLANFTLTAKQKEAALARGVDIAITAGAGSGKTSTLVARYASLLADGYSLRRIVAITFSDKAAREMRSRVRQTLNNLVKQATTDDERQYWGDLNAEMDSARISTIHSLCAEILRANPAEAGVDPKFEVLDEGLTAALRVQIVEDSMTELVGKPEFLPLFQVMGTNNLAQLLAFLLSKRLEAQEAFSEDIDVAQVIRQAMESELQNSSIAGCITELRGMKEAGEELAPQVEELLALWDNAENELVSGNLVTCAGLLYQARREKMSLSPLKKSPQVKEIVKELQTAYDERLNPLCGGKTKNDPPPNADSEASFSIALNLFQSAFKSMVNSYKEALRQRRGLDFDDLENGAAQLLKLSGIKKRWQDEVDALLVDEFQDTNERQRQIVQNIAGSPGKLFVVGDAKQSIYRFRRADVTVFRSVQKNIKNQGGLVRDLDETFRSHEPLLDVMGDLLKVVMGTQEDSSRPYYVPYSSMIAYHKSPPKYISEPHVEFVLGVGDDTASARPVAARALASRLLELKQQGQIQRWDDVALLFRASTGFPDYENAFEEANIPFVTVAGRGFYNRAEIRDILNILYALANPSDDLAMAGLLRSPAFGLTDTALYQLRWQEKTPTHYWPALKGDLSKLDSEDQQRAKRILSIMNELIPYVDRIPVAELLKKLVDATNYRVVLAIGDNCGTGGRLWRNLDKLIADAQISGKVNVRDFLDYLTITNDAGAREGEAPADAHGSVRLMTIHKSKGLQFPIVVLADASRTPRGGSEIAYLSANLGLAFKLDPPPLLYRLAKWQDRMQSDAEGKRVLYVALTRAQQKIIISGHTTPTNTKGWTTIGWLNDLITATNVDLNSLVEKAGKEVNTQTILGHKVRALAYLAETSGVNNDEEIVIAPPLESDSAPIYAPLTQIAPEIVIKEKSIVPTWRTTGSITEVPPGVIGEMVHKALELWIFPSNPQLQQLLNAAALDAGLAQPSQRVAAVSHSMELLNRFYNSPLRKEIEEAIECYHELPYSRIVGDHVENGYIDLLYCSKTGWQIVDFKTDSIRGIVQRSGLINEYTQQMRRYSSVITALLGQQAQARLCFLDDQEKVELVVV